MTSKSIVYIKWEDHWSEDQAWTHHKKLAKKHDKEKVYIIETVGFLLNENDVSIMVGLSYASDGMVDGNIVILKKNIVDRQVLRLQTPEANTGTFDIKRW